MTTHGANLSAALPSAQPALSCSGGIVVLSLDCRAQSRLSCSVSTIVLSLDCRVPPGLFCFAARQDFAGLVSQVTFLHPPNTQQIDERAERPVSEAVFRGPGVAV